MRKGPGSRSRVRFRDLLPGKDGARYVTHTRCPTLRPERSAVQDTIPVRGLHHVTATVAAAQSDLDFYGGVLGLRLIKKTVNFDNHNVYHFYYGNDRGDPGTLMTTFPYEGWGVRRGVQGAGQITVTSFSVPEASLGLWRARLEGLGVNIELNGDRFGEEWIALRDPSGLQIELIANGHDERPGVAAGELPQGSAICGLYGITMAIRDPSKTIAFLTEVLGWTVEQAAGDRTRLVVNGGGPGRIIDVLYARNAPESVNGLGTVHHVAMGVDDEESQRAALEKLRGLDLAVTQVHDRQYFKSIYFREPGGVLYEIATLGPGFLVDEKLGELGRSLQLPPWEESNRESIERHLPSVRY